MNTIYDAVIIGGGQAGLATGYRLQQAGQRFVILEGNNHPVGSWPRFYDSLSLNSPARYSALPGLPFPGDPDHYPVRDEVVAYLEQYAHHFQLPVITGAWVKNVERVGHLFRVTTTDKGSYIAQTVVAATGFFGRPYIPDIAGRTTYQGRMLHMADYHTPGPFEGQRIVIVGGGNGAVQVGIELAQAARVTLATRRPIRYMPQRVLGQDVHFWLTLSGLDRTQWLGDLSNPVYDTGAYRAAIIAGNPDRQPMFERFTEDGVIWSNGRHESVDAVIFSTGYRPHLPYLAGLNAIDESGRVQQKDGASTTVPGLYYVGLPRQHSVASATLRGVGVDSKLVTKNLTHYSTAQQHPAGKPLLKQQARLWSTRSSELFNLFSVLTFSVKEQLVTEQYPLPKIAREAVARSAVVGAGFLGFGEAAPLYSQH